MVECILMTSYLYILLKPDSVKNCFVHQTFLYKFCRKCSIWKNMSLTNEWPILFYEFKFANKVIEDQRICYFYLERLWLVRGPLNSGSNDFRSLTKATYWSCIPETKTGCRRKTNRISIILAKSYIHMLRALDEIIQFHLHSFGKT